MIGTDLVKYSYHQETNHNGQLLYDLAEATDLIIGNTVFRKRYGKMMTHLNSGTGTKSQIDYVLVRRKWRGCLQDVEAYSSLASLGSDHRVVVATVKLRLRANAKQSRRARYDWSALAQDSELQGQYAVEVRNMFENLQVEDSPEQNITTEYSCLVEANKEAAAKLLPQRKRDRKLLASEDSRVNSRKSRTPESIRTKLFT